VQGEVREEVQEEVQEVQWEVLEVREEVQAVQWGVQQVPEVRDVDLASARQLQSAAALVARCGPDGR
jgi:archaellum component FlaC